MNQKVSAIKAEFTSFFDQHAVVGVEMKDVISVGGIGVLSQVTSVKVFFFLLFFVLVILNIHLHRELALLY